MGEAEFDYSAPRPAWNAGRKVAAKRPLKPRQIWLIRFHLDREHRLRDRALFDLAIDSKLRGRDLVKIKIGDFVAGGEMRTRAMVIQQKTGRPVQFEIMTDARGSLLAWLERRGGSIEEYVFPSRIDHAAHMAHDNMRVSSMNGSRRLASEARTTEPTRCAEQRHRSFTRRPGICALCKFCLVTPRLKTWCDISASMLKMR